MLESHQHNRLWAWHPSAQQQAFRSLMTAFSYPGRVMSIGHGRDDTQQLLLATLVDGATSLADATGQLHEDDWRLLGVQPASIDTARFVLADGMVPLDATPALGSLENPDQGATVILRVDSLHHGTAWRLSGPGIPHHNRLLVTGMDPRWWHQRTQWNAGFPMGVDMVLIAEQGMVALPRTIHIEHEGDH